MFDPNDGECLQSETTDESCPEGFYTSSYYDFWMLGGSTPASVGWNPRILATRSYCNGGRGTHYGNVERNNHMACADVCQENSQWDGCAYFHYDPNDGECFQAYSEDDSCPAGFTASNWYDFYGI